MHLKGIPTYLNCIQYNDDYILMKKLYIITIQINICNHKYALNDCQFCELTTYLKNQNIRDIPYISEYY